MRVEVTVQKWIPIGGGRVRAKIAQSGANLIDMHYNGKDYVVLRNLGRGRYIVKEVLRANQLQGGEINGSNQGSLQ